ncbi:MAG: exodeoxyribonuclease VII large subunit [Clostridia bacterium]|nr:exodeoxyribonuclease VII large subunit [Clostridia bacterium]
MINTITVSQLNNYVKSLLENDSRLNIVSVSGEISNFKNHFSSGHWYFTLKDQNASVRCVMFKSCATRIKFSVEDGLQVIIRGRVSLYEKDGQYQFYAEEMHPVGEGDLALAFKQIKEKLEKEGLFDISTKRALVKFPKRIAVVTSDTGAAIKDILNITSKRYPACEIVVCPVLVQGGMAASDMISTLERVYALDNIDTIIIGRGGGSAEDLHCFNDEALARKLYESPFPVISAVGHETDFTICDFVADVRASTPSHAAELAVPDCSELHNRLTSLNDIIKHKTTIRHNFFVSKLSAMQNIFNTLNFERIIQNKQISIDRTLDKISSRVNNILQTKTTITSSWITRIDALSPLKIMSRGFSIILKDGKTVTDSNILNVGDEINVRLSKGDVKCHVTDITN